MRIAITGGGGFLGLRLARTLLSDPTVEVVALSDVAPTAAFAGDPRVQVLVGDLSEPATAERVAGGADLIFHLAAVVSGQAERDFDLGMRVNLEGTRLLLEAARKGGRNPVFVFASSLAVFGPPLPRVVTEETPPRPQSSYGAQKAMGELLVADFSRKGFVDGRTVRLPTVCVRPGKPNAAASSFVSGIIREPLNGERAVCPVDRDLELWLTSPATAVRNLVRAAKVEASILPAYRAVNLPGITVSVAEMLSVLERVGGAEAARRVSFEENPAVRAIVDGWPARFDVSRALAMGFTADPGFDALARAYLAERAERC